MTAMIMNGAESTNTYVVVAQNGDFRLSVRSWLNEGYAKNRQGQFDENSPPVYTWLSKWHITRGENFNRVVADIESKTLAMDAFGIPKDMMARHSVYLTQQAEVELTWRPATKEVVWERAGQVIGMFIDTIMSAAEEKGATRMHVEEVTEWIVEYLRQNTDEDFMGFAPQTQDGFPTPYLHWL